MRKIKKPFLVLFICVGLIIFFFLGKFIINQITTIKAAKAEEIHQQEISEPITLAAVGDILVHNPIYEEAYSSSTGTYDFTGYFSEVKQFIDEADIAYANVETMPSAGDVLPVDTYPTFSTPNEIIDSLIATGFNIFSLASNHSLDYGLDGIEESIKKMNEVGADNEIMWSGINSSPEAQQEIPVMEVNGVTISFLSFTDILNSSYVPDDYSLNVYSEELANELVTQAKEVSDVQIVSMHWGTENSTEVNDRQREIATYLESLGVDIILGTHPHVVQPVEMVGDCLVFYSLGNFLSAQEQTLNQTGGIFSVTFRYDPVEDKVIFDEYSVIPTYTLYNCNNPYASSSGSCWSNFEIKINDGDFYIGDYSDSYQIYLETLQQNPELKINEYPLD